MIGFFPLSMRTAMMSTKEGLTKALQTLEIAVVKEKPGPMFWAKE